MAFSPNLFLSNIRSKDGPAKTSRFEVILPIPPYINSFVGNSILEKILNFPNSIFSDVSDAINSALGRPGAQEDSNGYSRTSNASLSRNLALQCESAELPGKTLITADVKLYQTQYGDTSLTFLCTNEFYERKLFDRWMEAIHPTDTNNLRFPKGDKSRYMTNIKIIQYDDFIKQIYAVELIDAFPIGVASQAVNWSDDAFHRLQVQFAYQRYKTIYEGTYDLGAVAAALFGAAGSRLLPFGRAL
jgi:hypothetical protein